MNIIFFVFSYYKKIPETDANCDWNWKHLRCEPYCQCTLQFQWGDYHLGRSCRNRQKNINNNDHHDVNTNNGDHYYTDTDTYNYHEECNLPPNTKLTKILNTSGHLLKNIGSSTKTKLQRLNFIIKTRVHDAKDDMCTTLFYKSGGGDYYDDDNESGEDYYYYDGTIRTPTRTRTDNTNQFLDQDDATMNGSELMEKPVRVLRKVLNCRNVLDNKMKKSRHTGRSTTASSSSSSIINNTRTGTRHPTTTGVRTKNNIHNDDDRERRKGLNDDNDSLKQQSTTTTTTTDKTIKDELHDVPVLSNNPLFVKSKNNNSQGLKNENNNPNNNEILLSNQSVTTETKDDNEIEKKDDDDDDVQRHRKIITS